jgi:hypothetical protein
METSFVDGEKQYPVKISSGDLKMPILYYDTMAFASSFTISSAAAKKLMPSSILKPALLVPGIAVLAIPCFEYRKTSIGPYNEVGICIPALIKPVVNIPALPLLFEKSFKNLGFYVHHLPVTTKIAYDAGRSVWNYPKFVCSIEFKDSVDRLSMILTDKKHILSVHVNKARLGKPKLNFWDMTTFTKKYGKIYRTVIRTKSMYTRTMVPGVSTLELGDHEISRELDALKISKSSIDTRYMPEMQSILPEAFEKHPA